jgi:hypothetical protein
MRIARSQNVLNERVLMPPDYNTRLCRPSRCTLPMTAKHWRDRAAFMRVLAETMADVEAHAIMLRLANDYDKLADLTARLADSEAPKKKRRRRRSG